jgi:signal transduction histidine kinase
MLVQGDWEAKTTLRTLSQHSQQELEMLVRQRTAAIRSLSACLLRVQDEERRRLARELHDTTGQTLTALKIQIGRLQRNLNDRHSSLEIIAEIDAMADQALQEIRTASYLLYPPLLDESGLVCAAEWYVEGFAKRSNIDVILHLPSIGRLPRLLETVLFRVLQEALTNAYRHAGSRIVEVHLRVSERSVVLEVRDYGKGMARDRLEQFRRTGSGVGVGLAGMRERIEDLSGRLEIFSDATGTLIRAVLPQSGVVSVLTESVASQCAAA